MFNQKSKQVIKILSIVFIFFIFSVFAVSANNNINGNDYSSNTYQDNLTPTPTAIISCTPTLTPTPTTVITPTPTVTITSTPTPSPTSIITPTPTATSNHGGPGDGKSDGRSDGRSSCPSCTQAPSGQVLGASTSSYKAVLGLSSTSGEENSLLHLIQLFGSFTSAGLGFILFKKNA